MKRISLQTKLMTCGLIVVLIPLLAVGVFSVFTSSKAMDNLEKEQLMNLRKVVLDQVDTMLEGQADLLLNMSKYDSLIQEIATDVGSTGVLAMAQFKLDMKSTIFHDKEVYGFFYVTDKNGNVIGDTSGGIHVGKSISDTDYFNRALEGETVIGDVVRMEENGLNCVVAASPLNWSDKGTVGVIVSGWRMDFIAKKILALKLGRSGYGFLIGSRGDIIVHPDQKLVMKGNVPKMSGMEKLGKRMISLENDIVSSAVNGIESIVAFGPIQRSGWSLGFVAPKAEVMAPIVGMRNILVIAILCVMALVIFAIFWMVRRSITRPINKIMSELDESAEHVFSASAQVSIASQSLAEGASEQASSLEETVSSLEEIASMTKVNAHSAVEADQLMKEANSTVKQAEESMTELRAAMEEMSKASDETSKIIGTIDEIAFQTNLLALNAAVEAARAGEAGAGFAVVADEVRNLAMRAAEAARNTSLLIEDTVKRISHGSSIVSATGDAFTNISKGAGKVGKIVGEIASASNEQAQGIEMLNTAVAEMDTIVQQNAASAEESAGASAEMNAQAERMKGVVMALMNLVGEGEKANSLKRKGGGEFKPETGGATGTPEPAKSLSAGNRKEIGPEAIIPLDDEGFTDF